jgi:hypothetical protein
MQQNHHASINRQAGADALSAKAIAIGQEKGLSIVKCEWDLGQDFGLQHAHRLDLFTETKTVRVYFPDLELSTTGIESRLKRSEERLRSAVAQLLSVPPAPTYSFR